MTEEKKVPLKIDRFFVDKKDFADFSRLKEKDSPFKGAYSKDIFLAAMVTGYKEGCKIELKSKEGYFHEKDLNEQEKSLIRAIAVSEEGALEVLLDKQRVYSIAEQYATGGIAVLKARIFSGEYGSYAKKLEGELIRAYEEIMKAQPKTAQTLEEIASVPVVDLIRNGETDSLEFKSSLIWDYRKKQPNRDIKAAVARTVSCFMNSNGGILLIGVGDDKTILGLDQDLAQLHNSHDDFGLTFTNAINKYLGKVNRAYVKIRFKNVDEKDIAVIVVEKSPHPVYLRCENKKEEFYIRSGNSCQPLDISEANLYMKDHWPAL